MKAVIRTTDPVVVSFASSVLDEAGVQYLVLDTNASIVEGSIGILPQRLTVAEDDVGRARTALAAAGLRDELEAG